MTLNPVVLLVDDEEDLCTLMSLTLARLGIQTQCAYGLQQAKKLLQIHHFNACLTDLNLPDGNGIQLVEHITAYFPNLPVAILTAYGNMETAMRALKAGAFDFLNKPLSTQHLTQVLTQAFNYTHSVNITDPLARHPQLIGESSCMQQLRITLKKLARSQAPVFITGESGTGKEVVAHLIHHLSKRHQGPFITINCGAIPADLMESEFFGYKKGSFTGATQHHTGLIVAADQGSLFLDEIAELPLHMQVKLLRAVQEKKIRPIGSDIEIKVDFRIISASHQNLEQLIQQGKFRQDLFFRIHVMTVALPALRERGHDILLLAHYFSHQIATEWGIANKPLSQQAQDYLLRYNYPGNVRELRNIIERAMTLCDDQVIDIQHLTTKIPSFFSTTTQHHTVQEKNVAIHPSATNSPTSLLPNEGLEAHLAQIEKDILLQALSLTHWNKTLAAKKLRMSFRSLRYRLKKFKLDLPE